MLTSAQARMKQEQDPVMKEIIDKGMTEKLKEMLQEENVDFGSRTSELTQQLLQKIVDEVAGYAKEHHILVVRREPRASLQFGNHHERERRAGFEKGERYERNAERSGPPPLWNNDVIYSSDQGSPNEVDISDEIVERLNKTDAEKQELSRDPFGSTKPKGA
jgi:hypothetical protein